VEIQKKEAFWGENDTIVTGQGNSSLLEAYAFLEAARLNLWHQLRASEVYQKGERLASIPPEPCAKYQNGVLSITIKDYLPHKKLVKRVRDSWVLKSYWTGCVSGAVEELRRRGVEVPVISPALCQIITYVPIDTEWDVDNRVYKYVIDGLRYAGVLDTDAWENMAFMVVGRIDKENPRTEINVFSPKQDLAKMVTV
jgi:hypothetical protein